MVIKRIDGTAHCIYSNKRVRLATVDTLGRRTYCAYVIQTKSIHQFEQSRTMIRFAEINALLPAYNPITTSEFKLRIRPFLLRLWDKRCKPGMTFAEAQKALEKDHLLHRGSGLMGESTWTEFDDEAYFLIPCGILLLPDSNPDDAILHHKANGWTYEPMLEVLDDIVESFK